MMLTHNEWLLVTYVPILGIFIKHIELEDENGTTLIKSKLLIKEGVNGEWVEREINLSKWGDYKVFFIDKFGFLGIGKDGHYHVNRIRDKADKWHCYTDNLAKQTIRDEIRIFELNTYIDIINYEGSLNNVKQEQVCNYCPKCKAYYASEFGSSGICSVCYEKYEKRVKENAYKWKETNESNKAKIWLVICNDSGKSGWHGKAVVFANTEGDAKTMVAVKYDISVFSLDARQCNGSGILLDNFKNAWDGY